MNSALRRSPAIWFVGWPDPSKSQWRAGYS